MSALADEIFSLALAMNRAAYGIADNPQRTAPPSDTGRTFGDLTEREQLDILLKLYDRKGDYAQAIVEAACDSKAGDRLFRAALDPDCTPADLGRRFRECILGYVEDVAACRGDQLEDL